MRHDLLAALVMLAVSAIDTPPPLPEPKRRRDEDRPKPIYNQSGGVTASTATPPLPRAQEPDPWDCRHHARPSEDAAAEQIRAERAKRKAEAWAKRNPKNNA